MLACTWLAASARAAPLQKVDRSAWSTKDAPEYVNMYVYVPDKLAPKPPILVASHHCGGSANSTFNETKGNFVALADQHGFVMILPEATGHNCWDVGSSKSLEHDGGGDTHAVAQMVRYALTKYSGDASRVYAFGTSSGAMMTQALLGVYPDLFAAGVAAAGVPCGCWAEQYSANNQWSGPCANGTVKKTASEWGELARSMFPGYMGHRPRVQLWHGTADTTINFNNMTESTKQWTNVLSLDASATTSDSQKSGFEHKSWKNDCGFVVLDTWAQQGAGHDVRWDPQLAAAFLGLDEVAGADPEAAACSASTSGAAGATSMNTAGSGGASGAIAPMASRTSAGSSAGSAGSSGSAAGAVATGAAGIGGASATAGRAAGTADAGVTTAGAVAATNMAGIATAASGSHASPTLTASPPSESGGCSVTRHHPTGGETPWVLAATLAALCWRRRRCV